MRPYTEAALRGSLVFALVLLTAPAIASLQAPAPVPRRGCPFTRPAPDCSVFALTNVGYSAKAYSSEPDIGFRGAVDWGLMLNTGSSNAIGATWYIGIDDQVIVSGPMLRYRRWLGSTASMEMSLGTSVTDNRGGVLGLVKYNPATFIGVTVRPEIWNTEEHICHNAICGLERVRITNVHIGAEVSGKPGFYASLLVASLGLLILGASRAVAF